jgi:hypothetical protein
MDAKKTTKKKEVDENVEQREKEPWESSWDDFDDERYEYVNWQVKDANVCFCNIKFESDAPVKFVNKWGREQWKLLVLQEQCQKWLSGGKRLFESVKRLCKEFKCSPRNIPGVVRINRIGKSVTCQYTAEVLP